VRRPDNNQIKGSESTFQREFAALHSLFVKVGFDNIELAIKNNSMKFDGKTVQIKSDVYAILMPNSPGGSPMYDVENNAVLGRDLKKILSLGHTRRNDKPAFTVAVTPLDECVNY
jgi:hypothetical protein